MRLCRYCKQELRRPCENAEYCFECHDYAGQRLAIRAVNAAVRKGLLPKPTTLTCVDCGKQAREYDHRDYNKPLEVQPVCRGCNKRRGGAIPVRVPVFRWPTFQRVA